MSILVTGGNGFIGAEIVRQLHERGDGPIHVAHRSDNLSRLGPLVDDVATHQIDLADRDGVADLVATIRPRVVHHFGAMLSGPGEADPQALLRTNVVGLIPLLEAARTAGVEQFTFASSIGTYGRDLGASPFGDRVLQRPDLVYGVSKVFGENLGAYYRVKYGFDFRGIRYPSIVGPGVTTRSIVQYTSWMIEHAARGEPFTVWVAPETAVPIQYYKDAARAAIDILDAPFDDIATINYIVGGVPPTPTARQLADGVLAVVPEAQISFEPDPAMAGLVAGVSRSVDDSCARDEWGWTPRFDATEMIADLVEQVRSATAGAERER